MGAKPREAFQTEDVHKVSPSEWKKNTDDKLCLNFLLVVDLRSFLQKKVRKLMITKTTICKINNDNDLTCFLCSYKHIKL